MKEKIDRNNLKKYTYKYIYDFQNFQTIISFGDIIFNGKTTVSEADKKQSNLLVKNL